MPQSGNKISLCGRFSERTLKVCVNILRIPKEMVGDQYSVDLSPFSVTFLLDKKRCSLKVDLSFVISFD